MKETASFRDILLASALYATSSIVGPLLLFGGSGMLLDAWLDTDPWLLVAGVGVAFIVTNILLFRKVAQLTRELGPLDKPSKQSKR